MDMCCRIYTEKKVSRKHNESTRCAFFVSKKLKTKTANRLPDKMLLERGEQFMSRIVENRSCVIRRYASKVRIRRPMNLYRRTYQGKPLPFFIYINVVDLVETCPPDATYVLNLL